MFIWEVGSSSSGCIDAWASIEELKMNWVHFNQNKNSAHLYNGLIVYSVSPSNATWGTLNSSQKPYPGPFQICICNMKTGGAWVVLVLLTCFSWWQVPPFGALDVTWGHINMFLLHYEHTSTPECIEKHMRQGIVKTFRGFQNDLVTTEVAFTLMVQ
jgi:hypothetical protein